MADQIDPNNPALQLQQIGTARTQAEGLTEDNPALSLQKTAYMREHPEDNQSTGLGAVVGGGTGATISSMKAALDFKNAAKNAGVNFLSEAIAKAQQNSPNVFGTNRPVNPTYSQGTQNWLRSAHEINEAKKPVIRTTRLLDRYPNLDTGRIGAAVQEAAPELSKLEKAIEFGKAIPSMAGKVIGAASRYANPILSGASAGEQGVEAWNRAHGNDTTGAVISGIGTAGDVASMAGFPEFGIPVSLGARGVNYLRDNPEVAKKFIEGYNPMPFASGGLVSLAEGGQPTVNVSAITPPNMSGMPGVGYMQMPQSAMLRTQLEHELENQARLRASATGMGMAIPGQHGVKMMPGNIEAGVNIPVGQGNVDISGYRSINPVNTPISSGHMHGANVRYTLPFAEGGDVKKPSAGIAGVNPDANEGGAFIGYPQINRNRQVGSGTGFLDALVGAQPSRTNVLNPSDASYMSGYEKGEPYGIASSAFQLGAPIAKGAMLAGTIARPSISEMLNALRNSGGTATATRLERAADLVPNLEHQFQPQALKEAFSGNRSLVSVMNPADFEKYAAPISSETKSSLSKSRRIGEPGPGQDYTHMPLGTYDDYIKYLQQFSEPGGGGFRSMPYLQLGQRKGFSFPNIQGHEGRHRTDALARQGNKTTLIGIEPRPELRELPRNSQEEYLNALAKEVGGRSPFVMPQESEIKRGLIELPEMFKKGGKVKKKKK